MEENEIGTKILEKAIEVHKVLGPGLFESVYEKCLAFELSVLNFKVKTQVPINIKYKNVHFDEGFRADIIVDEKVIIELKSVETVSNVHKKQLQTYLKLTGLKLGYLLNFNEELLKDGIVRCVNSL